MKKQHHVGCFVVVVVALCVGWTDTRTDSALQAIVECMTGPAQETVDEACEWVDVNDDGHVDLLDYYYLQRFWKCAIPEGCGLGMDIRSLTTKLSAVPLHQTAGGLH